MTEDPSIKLKKVLLMGLDNSGKTSIVLCLMGVKNLSSFSSLNPTRGVKINKFQALGSEYSIWDFGGQEQFRDGYLNDFQTHIKGTKKFIYVLDIQDWKRYDISLEYLGRILDRLRKHKITIDFSIFLHKYDPDLEFINSKFDESVISDLIRNIKKLIPYDFAYQIYKTSIYTVFQKLAL
ncbi:MAG TPA: ADP-ribosylation factor-like protein [Candidatus Nanopelagicaceae bacterium]|nr:ADP-ribosylation factor-like protein [Candidatus Nanopelagicaceae bacterium]